MPRIRAAIFDLGHTLWDFAPREETRRLCALRLYERLEAEHDGGAPAPAALDREMDSAVARWLKDWDGDRLEQPPTERLVSEALGPLGLAPEGDLLQDLTAIFFGRELDVPFVEPDSLAAIAILDERGIAIGCVTNTITLEEGIRDVLSRLGLTRYLRSVVVSSAMGYRKPHPSLFQRALDEMDVSPREAVFVGDRLDADVRGAQAVGMRAVLTHQYRREPPDPSTATPDAVIRHLAELPAVIERMDAAQH